VGARDQALLIARDPLAVVVELGRDAAELVEVVVALGLERRDLLLELAGRRLLLLALGHYDRFASSSITS
jgi:hypothetical protein